MNILIKIGKGFLIGLANIAPGVSGSLIATFFNIYEELIDALNELTKRPLKAIFSIWHYLLGVAIGIIFGALLFLKLLETYPTIITFFFIGLIFGGLPAIIKEEKDNEIKWFHYLISIISGILILSLLLIESNNVNNHTGITLYLVYALIGFIIAVPIIIPGLSGTTILMILGYFTLVVTTIENSLGYLKDLNFLLFLEEGLPLLIMIVGALVGLLLFARLVKYILTNHKTSFNMAILGLLIVAPINIIVSINKDDHLPNVFSNINLLIIIISIIALVGGFILTYLTSGTGGNKNEMENI